VSSPDLAAEQALLGAMILSANARGVGLDQVDAADFTSPAHAEIFASVRALHGRGEGVDAVTVLAEWRRSAQVPDPTDGAKILGLMIETPVTSHVTEYAREVVTAAVARRARGILAEAQRALAEDDDPYAVLDTLQAAVGELDRPSAGCQEALTVEELARDIDVSSPWVIPGLMRRGWRCVIVAHPGSGKSVLLRALAQMSSQGVHPLRFGPQAPQRALVVDLENSDDVIAETGLTIADRLVMHVGDRYDPTRCRFWRRPDGLDLRSRADRQALEREIALQRPTLVCIGPAYKAVRRRGGAHGTESHEEATEPFLAVLDDLRTRYGFALVVEHHSAKGSEDPYGSQRWLAWPELGFFLRRLRDGRGWELTRRRGDRMANAWPEEIHQGDHWPWIGLWGEKPDF